MRFHGVVKTRGFIIFVFLIVVLGFFSFSQTAKAADCKLEFSWGAETPNAIGPIFDHDNPFKLVIIVQVKGSNLAACQGKRIRVRVYYDDKRGLDDGTKADTQKITIPNGTKLIRIGVNAGEKPGDDGGEKNRYYAKGENGSDVEWIPDDETSRVEWACSGECREEWSVNSVTFFDEHGKIISSTTGGSCQYQFDFRASTNATNAADPLNDPIVFTAKVDQNCTVEQQRPIRVDISQKGNSNTHQLDFTEELKNKKIASVTKTIERTLSNMGVSAVPNPPYVEISGRLHAAGTMIREVVQRIGLGVAVGERWKCNIGNRQCTKCEINDQNCVQSWSTQAACQAVCSRGPNPNPFQGPAPQGTQFTFSIESPTKYTTLKELLDAIAKTIFNLLLVISPIVIIYAGVIFLTSGGEPGQVKKAKNALTYAMIGLFVAFIGKGFLALIKDVLGVTG